MTTQERVGLLGAAGAAAALAWPTLTDTTGLALLCPLRTFTGIPCPLCGMTTASVALVRGDLGAAVAANPFILALAAFTLAMAVIALLRLAGRAQTQAPPSAPSRPALWVLAAGVAASEAWQLSRFGLL